MVIDPEGMRANEEIKYQKEDLREGNRPLL
jgi:hypothetical protein